MALTDLIQKITDEANKKAAFMKQVADEEIKKIKDEAGKKAEVRKSEIDKKADDKSSSVMEKAKTLASMEARSQMLKEKREVIGLSYSNVQKKLEEMSSADYTELITKMLQSVSKNSSKGSLIIPSSRKKETEDAIKKANVDYKVEDSTKNIVGGFILTSGKIEYNLTFSYLIEKIIRPATELEVAQILFS